MVVCVVIHRVGTFWVTWLFVVSVQARRLVKMQPVSASKRVKTATALTFVSNVIVPRKECSNSFSFFNMCGMRVW